MTQFRVLIAIRRGRDVPRLEPGEIINDLPARDARQLLLAGAIEPVDEDAPLPEFTGQGAQQPFGAVLVYGAISGRLDGNERFLGHFATKEEADAAIEAAFAEALAAPPAEAGVTGLGGGQASLSGQADLPPVSVKLTETRLREIAAAEGVPIEDDANKATMVKLIMAKRAA